VTGGLALAEAGRGAGLPEDPRDVPTKAMLSQVRSEADLDGDGHKEELWLVNALTGAKEPGEATEVILGVVAGRAPEGKRADLLWSRHVSRETGEPAHHGELTALDLDGDGGAELLLTWSQSLEASVRERWAEIYAIDPPFRPRRVWEGIWQRDTTRKEGLPPEQQHRFKREIDYGATRAAAGVAIVFEKTVYVAAGRELEPPKQSQQRVAVQLRPRGAGR
jgi:hypothetical protein